MIALEGRRGLQLPSVGVRVEWLDIDGRWVRGFAMNLDQTLSELAALPVAERLRAVEMLWDRMADEALSSIPPEQRAEIRSVRWREL